MKIPFIYSTTAIICALSVSAFGEVKTDPEMPPNISELKTAANSSEAKSEDWVALGDALMQKARDTVAHDFAAAEIAYKKAMAMESSSTGAMLGMAWVKNSEHLFEQGKGWAEKALAFDPRLVDAHSLLGDYALERGSYDEAFDHYQAAIDLRGDLSTYSRAASLIWLTGDSSRAQVLMEKAIEKGGPYPENTAWCRVELATMQFNLGAILPAELQTKKALHEAPKNPRALAMMGRLCAAKGDLKDAIGWYEKSIEITPTHQALAAFAKLQKLLKTDSAEAAFESVVAFHRPDPQAVAAHGHLHDKSQGGAALAMFLAQNDADLEAALAEAEKAYEIYRNIHVEEAIAWCYYKLGNYSKARLMIERAMKWNTSDPSMLFHRGMIQYKVGNLDLAVKYLRQAISLNPNFDPTDASIAKEVLSILMKREKTAAKNENTKKE